jgi:adenylyltransferase/sulfurtransferase
MNTHMIAEPLIEQTCHLTIDDFYTLLDEHEVLVVDVRNYDEQPVIDGFADRRLPLDQLANYLDELDADAIVFVCQDGTRSAEAIALAKSHGMGIPVYSLEGGITAWLRSKE